MKRLTGILKERIILLFYRRTAACGLVQPSYGDNTLSCSMNLVFGDFAQDLRMLIVNRFVSRCISYVTRYAVIK